GTTATAAICTGEAPFSAIAPVDESGTALALVATAVGILAGVNGQSVALRHGDGHREVGAKSAGDVADDAAAPAAKSDEHLGHTGGHDPVGSAGTVELEDLLGCGRRMRRAWRLEADAGERERGSGQESDRG